MISLILIVLAAICDSIMDVCQFHYHKSIFTRFNKPMYWDGTISWKKKYINWDAGDRRMRKWIFGLFNYPVQLTDAWHLFKSLMLTLFCVSVVVYCPLTKNMLLDVALYGCTWNLVFYLFYNHFLVIKHK